ncbi:MAG: response regulator [Nitrospirota bacterium]|nr:response regulator [Nitrospirota bacterium]
MTDIKVLLVDDEVEFASALSERLRLRSYEAKAIYRAEDAIPFVKSDKPDVVLLDLKMPGMDGIEILEAIKQFDPTIEVIILTGHGDTESADKGIKTGAFDYIMKPVDIGELITKIEQAKKKKNSR